MSRVAVVGGRWNQTNERLVAEWRGLGIQAELLSGAEARAQLRQGDIAVGRIDVLRTLESVEPGLLDLLLLERGGVHVRNRAFSLLAVHDKLRTARLLEATGLPHPRVGLVRSPEDALPVAPPFVVKPRFGSWGLDVFRCAGESEARQLLRIVAERPWFGRHGALVQELVPSRYKDLRLLVAGKRVVGAVERVAAPGDWRTNVSLGGTKAPVDPDDAARRLAVAAAGAVGGDLVGVDLIPLATGEYVVLELNGAIDFDEDYALRGRDVFRETARALALAAAAAPAVSV